jgi:hypothetical protein
MARKRKSLRPSVRFEVFKRDGFTCGYCGSTPPAVVLEVDHIIAVANGGTDEVENLLTACRDCNAGKGARSLESTPSDVADRLDVRREAAEQLRLYNEFLLEQRERETAAIERLGSYWFRSISPRSTYIFGTDRERSMRRFIKGLTEVELVESIDTAMLRKPAYGIDHDEQTWRYFCGVCWSKIREKGAR